MLGEASAMIDDMAGDDAEPPPSVYWYTPTFFRMNIGLTHFTLGDMTAAVDYLSAGLADLRDDHKATEWAREYWEVLSQARAFS
ncbi:hypothetical protein EKD16_22735 [Streptomonospora litoralis]|uniref:Tetratricopeptide repeat protein n=2 Tax=Streptomonospora litoralis TaxID=2498135 RepID=A0A4P6Q7E9_9ACTN|nr:hypothetical protein EKD16_22735 [Streptomonospora litoralis]